MIPAAPKLRFPEFKTAWKPSHAGEAFKNSRAKGAADLPIYSVTMDRGLVPRRSLDRHMGADAADGQNLRAQRGDIVYNMMRMWQGAVGLAHEECMVSPAYVVLSPKKHTSSGFFIQWFKAKRMLYLLGAYSHGITSDRLRLYADDFVRIPLHIPTLPEQQKIADFLSAVDAKIDAVKRKRDAFERYKKGLMQQIFSQKIRFKKDDGSEFSGWEEKRLREVATFSKGKGISKADIIEDGITPCIRYGELYTRYGNRITKVASYTNVPSERLKLSKGGEVIIPASGETAEDIATASVVIPAGVALGGDLNIIHSNQSGLFLAYYLSNNKRQEIASLAQGNSVVHLYPAQLSDLPVCLPSLPEQKKIADFLSTIDAKIDVITSQILKLEAFKKGLLQQMFV